MHYICWDIYAVNIYIYVQCIYIGIYIYFLYYIVYYHIISIYIYCICTSVCGRILAKVLTPKKKGRTIPSLHPRIKMFCKTPAHECWIYSATLAASSFPLADRNLIQARKPWSRDSSRVQAQYSCAARCFVGGNSLSFWQKNKGIAKCCVWWGNFPALGSKQQKHDLVLPVSVLSILLL